MPRVTAPRRGPYGSRCGAAASRVLRTGLALRCRRVGKDPRSPVRGWRSTGRPTALLESKGPAPLPTSGHVAGRASRTVLDVGWITMQGDRALDHPEAPPSDPGQRSLRPGFRTVGDKSGLSDVREQGDQGVTLKVTAFVTLRSRLFAAPASWITPCRTRVIGWANP